VLLRRLAAGRDISALQTLVSVIEPVKEYKRYQVRPQTMLSPLTGLIDAAQPDAPGGLAFNRSVDEMLAGINPTENAAKLRSMINEWRTFETGLKDIMERSPALAEATQLATDFKNLNQIALEALDSLAQRSPQSGAWRDARMATLAQIAKPKAGLEFATVAGVRKLINAASTNSN